MYRQLQSWKLLTGVMVVLGRQVTSMKNCNIHRGLSTEFVNLEIGGRFFADQSLHDFFGMWYKILYKICVFYIGYL